MAKRLLSTQRIVNLAADPATGTAGEIYYNTVSNSFKYYDGSAWVAFSAGGSGNSFTTIDVPSGTDPVADSSSDTLNITASNGMVVTGDSSTDTINFTTNATPLNTASTIVSRDADQSFDITAIDFDTSDTISSAFGRLRWNSAEGTISLGISSTKDISIGEDQIYRVRNSTGSTLNKGVAVYFSGIEPSGRIDVSPYVADGSVREVRFMGLVAENINNGVNGFVQNFGYVTGLDTRGTASTAISVGDEDWAAGDILYVHPTVAGKLTKVKPQHEIIVAIIIKRHQTEGVLFVKPSSGGHLEDIHNISITSPLTGHTIVYNSTLGLWQNKSIINEVIPNQQQQDNKFLTTNGETLSWGTATTAIENTVSAMVSNNTESGISVDFDNTSKKLNFSISDQRLLNISALSNTANTIFYFNGNAQNVFSTATLTEYGRSIIASENTAAAKTLLGISNVENTALSSFTGSSSITSVGTVTSGTWNANTISATFIDSAIARLNSPTFTGTVVLPVSTSIGDVSNIEISYLDGVTSAIQTQLNGKASTTDLSTLQTQVNGKLDSSVASTTYAPLASPTFTGTVTLTSATVVGLVGVPSQTSHSGKYLTTDGTNPSWSAINSLKYSATAPSSPAVGDIWVESDVDVTGLDPHHYVRWTRVLTGSQSSFSGISSAGVLLEYTPGREQVYLNGVLLLRGTDYTATDGLTVVLSTAATTNDVVEIVALNVLNVANTYSISQIDSALTLKANLASPTFTGVPAAPTASVGTNTTQIATTAFISGTIDNEELLIIAGAM